MLGGLSVVVVRVLLLTEIFVDADLDVLLLDVVVLDFAAVDDDVERLVDTVGRVARVAVRGGMEEAVRVWLCLVLHSFISGFARDHKAGHPPHVDAGNPKLEPDQPRAKLRPNRAGQNRLKTYPITTLRPLYSSRTTCHRYGPFPYVRIPSSCRA